MAHSLVSKGRKGEGRKDERESSGTENRKPISVHWLRIPVMDGFFPFNKTLSLADKDLSLSPPPFALTP